MVKSLLGPEAETAGSGVSRDVLEAGRLPEGRLEPGGVGGDRGSCWFGSLCSYVDVELLFQVLDGARLPVVVGRSAGL